MANNQRYSTLSLQLATDSAQQIHLLRLEAHEQLSAHFRATIEIETMTEIDLLPNLGLPATVKLTSETDDARYINGIVIDIQAIDIHAHQPRYRLTLAPKLYLQQHGRNFRIFQSKTLIEIVKEVLSDPAVNVKYEVKAQGGTRMMPYCVQYGESNYNFVSRLLEQLSRGIR